MPRTEGKIVKVKAIAHHAEPKVEYGVFFQGEKRRFIS